MVVHCGAVPSLRQRRYTPKPNVAQRTLGELGKIPDDYPEVGTIFPRRVIGFRDYNHEIEVSLSTKSTFQTIEVVDELGQLNGPIFVEGITLFATSQPVYNLKIFGEHVYRVGNQGVLVHNSEQCTYVLKNDGPIFRGGSELKARLGTDVKVDSNALIQTLGKNGMPQGLSLNIDPKDVNIQKYWSAFPVERIPGGLQILPVGRPGHFVVAVSRPMPFDEFQQLLSKIILGTTNKLP